MKKMNQVLKISLIVIIILISWSIGAGTGIFYEKQLLAPSLNKAEKVASDLRSKVIGSITAYGKITNISGRTLTIMATADNKDILQITIKNDAPVFAIASQNDSAGKTTTNAQQKSEFKDLKTGDNVAVSIKLLANNQLEGQSVIIFSK